MRKCSNARTTLRASAPSIWPATGATEKTKGSRHDAKRIHRHQSGFKTAVRPAHIRGLNYRLLRPTNADPARRIPGARRRLRVVPYGEEWRTLFRWTAHGHALRLPALAEHHAGS